jgi:anti-anti-sigma factor
MIIFNFLHKKNILICIFEKRIDANIANEVSSKIKLKIDELVGQNTNSDNLKIIFDLKNTDYVSSLFLRVVVITAHQLNNDNFTIINANQFVKDLFKTSGLDKFIHGINTVEQIKKYHPPKNFSNNARIKNIKI